jgi:hypothetical protein
MNEMQDPEHERVTDGYQRVAAAEHYAVDNLLDQHHSVGPAD